MTNELKDSMLAKPIHDLPVSDDFKIMAAENGFETMEEILSFSLSSLLKKEKFSMHILEEIYKLLEKERFVELLKIE